MAVVVLEEKGRGRWTVTVFEVNLRLLSTETRFLPCQ